MMKTSDRIIGPSRGTQAEAKEYARVGMALRRADVNEYIDAVYALCDPDDFPDASIVVAQSVHETSDPGPWQSDPWNDWLNPAGMGITFTGEDPGFRFETGEESARAHVSHLLVYSMGPADAGSLWFRRTGRRITDDDPRYEAYVTAFGNVSKGETIDDFGSGVWAVDPKYAEKWVARGNAVYPHLEDQEEPTMPETMPTIPVHWRPVPAGAQNNPSGLLLPGDLIVVWHENGNPNSDADDEAGFLLSGGGPAKVSYHFAVDHEKAYQMFALNELCWHAADGCDNPSTDRGCYRGVAIEHCQDRDHGRWEATKRNGAILTAMIISGHPSIHFGGRAGSFSADRIETHQAVSDTNKHCPDWMLDEHAIPSQIARVRALLATPATTTTAPPVAYPPKAIDAPDHIEAQGHVLTVNDPRRFRCIQGQTLRTAPSLEAPAATKTPAKAGRVYTFDYSTTVDGAVWLVSKHGSWALARGFEEAA